MKSSTNSRFKFALTEEQKSKRTLDQIVAAARGNKESMIAVAAAVIGVKQQQNPSLCRGNNMYRIGAMTPIGV